MKKIALFFIVIAFYITGNSQEKGDSLAILYQRVYAYKNPADLSTRYHKIPFSYFNKNKLVFISESEKYRKYFQAKTVEGDTIFVKAKYVSADQNLTHAQILQDIKDGKRKKTHGEIADLTQLLPTWVLLGIWLIFVFLLYRFWKRFARFDQWFCKKAWPRGKPIKNAWFIKYAALLGLIAGSTLLFAKHEFRWFLQEGFQIWGNYPSNWDWVLWGAFVGIAVVVIAGIIQSFLRFSVKYAIIYSILVFILSLVYFVVGMVISVFVIVLFILSKMGGTGGSGGSGSSGSGSGSNTTPGSDNSPVGAFKYDDSGQRYIKNSGGSWEKRDGIL